VLAITTTGGNVGAEITYKNALRACEFLGILDVPVGKSDVVIKSPDASHIHGEDGLGNASKYLPRVRVPKISLSSDELLEKLTKKYPEIQILTF
jgi:inosine-uridine nucleoside N-ribohydrolase